MNPDMFLEIPWLCKRSFTLFTTKRFLPSVNANMTHKVSIVSEDSTAVFTCVVLQSPLWLLPTVVQHMSFEILGTGKGCPAFLTRERLGTCVCATVLRQLAGRGEGHPTFMAQVRFETLVPTHVIFQGP